MEFVRYVDSVGRKRDGNDVETFVVLSPVVVPLPPAHRPHILGPDRVLAHDPGRAHAHADGHVEVPVHNHHPVQPRNPSCCHVVAHSHTLAQVRTRAQVSILLVSASLVYAAAFACLSWMTQQPQNYYCPVRAKVNANQNHMLVAAVPNASVVSAYLSPTLQLRPLPRPQGFGHPSLLHETQQEDPPFGHFRVHQSRSGNFVFVVTA